MAIHLQPLVVHDYPFRFADLEAEVCTTLITLTSSLKALISFCDEGLDGAIVSKPGNDTGTALGDLVVSEQEVQKGAKNTSLRSYGTPRQCGDAVIDSHHLGFAHQKVQNPIAQMSVQS